MKGNAAVALAYDGASMVRNGKIWSNEELKILKEGRLLKLDKLQERLPDRTRTSIWAMRTRRGLTRDVPWTRGEDEELKRAAKTMGVNRIQRLLPHRTCHQIEQRAKQLNIKIFKIDRSKLTILGEPLADAIRQRAKEDGISIRALDRELGTTGYFTNVAALRARRGSGPYMPAIRKAIEFFEAELITAPDGSMSIDWKDE